MSLDLIFPMFVLPLFYKLVPLKDGILREKIERIACELDFKIAGIYIIDGSKRSTHPNAFFAGMGKFRRIVLFDTLVKTLTNDEVLAVLAHEMGHNIKHHIQVNLLLSLSTSLVGFFVLSLVMDKSWFYEAFGFAEGSAYDTLFIFLKPAGSIFFFPQPFYFALSRKHEYEADRFPLWLLDQPNP